MAYFIRWETPNSTDGLDLPRDNQGTLEIGLKRDFAPNISTMCDLEPPYFPPNYSPTFFSHAGLPEGVEARWDYEEDFGDWVVWMADLNLIQSNHVANPGAEYVFRIGCANPNGVREFENDTNGWAGDPNLQVQIGHWQYSWKDPQTTKADQSLNLIPKEEGAKTIPNGATDPSRIYTYTFAPWLPQNGFETGTDPWSRIWGVMGRVVGNSPIEGGAYLNMGPTAPGNTAKIRQDFNVYTFSTEDPQFEAGVQSELQYDGVFRCPTWADEWIGAPGSNCWIQFDIIALNGNQQTWSFPFYIPPNGYWFGVPRESTDIFFGDATSFRIEFAPPTRSTSTSSGLPWP